MTNDLPLRLIGYAWGDSYVGELLTFAIPALLAPGNLPAVAPQLETELVLVSEERLFAKIADHPIIRQVQKLCPVRLLGLDDLVTRSDKYGMTLTFALHRAFADLGPAMTNHWLVFFNADFILADGSLRNLLSHLRRGERVVASPSYCTVKEQVLPELKRRLAINPTALAFAPREMARLILQHRHNTIRGRTINQDQFHLLQADQFYWEVDEDTLIGHQMPVAIVGMRPQRYVSEPNSYWDHGFISELCPTANVKVLGDSDEFLMLELRGGTVAKEQIVAGLPDPHQLAERMITWVTPYQASFALLPLTLHAADLPASIESARGQLDDFVTTVLSSAPEFPSHIDHPQWNYHWPDFMKSRHAFLSARLGSVTGLQPPPVSTLPTDRIWWHYDGAEKSLARKKRLISTERDRKIGCLEEELDDLEGELAALLERGAFSTIVLEQATNANGRPPTVSDPELQRQIGLIAEKKRELEQSIATVETSFRQTIDPLEGENSQLRREYETLIQPRVKSAGIPIVRWGSRNEPPPGSMQGRARQIARSFYHMVFGRWPRLTMLNPYWPCTQPLLQAIETAKSAGAKDVLLVSEPPGLARGLTGFSGKVACVSYSGFAFGLLHKALEQREQFDLAIIELQQKDTTQFSEILALATPYVRMSGMAVGFSLLNGQLLSEAQLQGLPGSYVLTGSAASAHAIAIYTAALTNGGSVRLLRLVRRLLRLAVNMPRFWWINRGVAAAARRGHKTEAAFATSVTIVVCRPKVEEKAPFGSQSDATASGVTCNIPAADRLPATIRT